MITLMSVIVAFLFAISLWYLSSNHKVTSVKLKATYLKFLPNRSWHRLTPAGGTFVSATGGTFQSDTPGTFVSAMGGTFDSDIPGTFESATGGTFNPLLSNNDFLPEIVLGEIFPLKKYIQPVDFTSAILTASSFDVIISLTDLTEREEYAIADEAFDVYIVDTDNGPFVVFKFGDELKFDFSLNILMMC